MREKIDDNPTNDIDRRLADFFASSKSRWTRLYAPSMQTSDAVREHVARKIEARPADS